MKVTNAYFALFGIASFCLAVAISFAPGVAPGWTATAAVEWLGNDYLFLALIGVLAAGFGGVLLGARSVTGLNQATPPAPEGVPDGRRPGAEFDRLLSEGIGLRDRLFGDVHRQARRRLRETAVRTVMRAENCSREAARRQVDDGTWTDDPKAAAFLQGDGPSAAIVRAGTVLWPSSFRQRARRTAEAIVERGDVE